MIYLICAIGLLFRLIAINQSLWLDEAIGAVAIKNFTYGKLITEFLSVDNHPPLYYLMLKLWASVFGYTELVLRIPSVVFGLLTILLMYKISLRELGNQKKALFASILLMTSQIHIYYSQEARMYQMATFFALMSIYYFRWICQQNSTKFHWIMFSFSITLMMITDYMPIFLLPVYPLYALLEKKNKFWWRKFGLSFLPLLIIGLIWTPIFIRQILGYKWLIYEKSLGSFINGGANTKQLVLLWMKFSLGRISITNKAFYYFVSLIVSIPFAIAIYYTLRRIKEYKFYILSIVVPITLSFLLSFIFPAFVYFRLLFLLPVFYFLIILGLMNIKSNYFSYGLLVSILLINIFSFYYYVRSPMQQRENWKDAVNNIENGIKENEVVLFSFPEPFASYRWYERKPEVSYGATDSIRANRDHTRVLTEELLKSADGVYYFEYLRDVSDPDSVVMNTIVENGFKESEIYGNFNKIGFIHYYTR